MSDLIVIGYPHETTAQRLWDELASWGQRLAQPGSRYQGRPQAAGSGTGTARDISDHGYRPEGHPGQVRGSAAALRRDGIAPPHDAEQQLMKALHGKT